MQEESKQSVGATDALQPFGGKIVQALPRLVTNGDMARYRHWREKVTLAMGQWGLGEALVNEFVSERVRDQALYLILDSLDESHANQVDGCSSAKEILEKLNLFYQDKSGANKYKILMDYLRYKKSEGDSVAEHIARLNKLRSLLQDVDLKALKEDESLYQVILVNSLPACFAPEAISEGWENANESKQTTYILIRKIIEKEKAIKS